jgi:hypothetical protein
MQAQLDVSLTKFKKMASQATVDAEKKIRKTMGLAKTSGKKAQKKSSGRKASSRKSTSKKESGDSDAGPQ